MLNPLTNSNVSDNDDHSSSKIDVSSGSLTPNSKSDGNSRKYKTIVCSYWLSGNCKRSADQCTYLHVMDMAKLPECKYKFEADCPRRESCPYRHLVDERLECPYYKRGFCKLCR